MYCYVNVQKQIGPYFKITDHDLELALVVL